jgi:hypothetical protein
MFGGAARQVDKFNDWVGDGAIFVPPLLAGRVASDVLHDWERMAGGDVTKTDLVFAALPGAFLKVEGRVAAEPKLRAGGTP